MGTLHAFLGDGAAAHPDRPWLVCDGQSWSYGEGAAICDRLAAGLARHGIRPGDRVGLLFTNCPEIVFCYFACFRLGAIAVPVNTRFQVPELVYALEHAGARLLIGQADLCAPLLEQRAALPELDGIFVTGAAPAGARSYDELLDAAWAPSAWPLVPDTALAVLLYTSGTTARPKGVMHSHASLMQQSDNYLAVLGAATYARAVVFVPLCHISGFSVLLLSAMRAQGTLWILRRFEPEAVLRTLQESRCTYSGGLPVMINALINHPRAAAFDLSSLLHFSAGGDCVPLELQNRFQALWGVPVDELCGMTEVMYCNQPFDKGERRPGAIGKPFGDVRIRLVDGEGRDVTPGAVGEIVVHSGALTPGYWNDPDNTAAAIRDGGLHTGDLARQDEDGFYWFVGRSKDIIIRGGSNISPGEVEDVLYAHPAVYEAGVVGIACAELGERVRAYVALKPDAAATAEDLTQWAASRLAAYKVPESIIFEASLPKGPTGKVLRKALRERVQPAGGARKD